LARGARRGRQRLGALDASLAAARRVVDRPSLSSCAPTSRSAARTSRTRPRPTAHRLGEDEVKLTKQRLGWPSSSRFTCRRKRSRTGGSPASAAPGSKPNGPRSTTRTDRHIRSSRQSWSAGSPAAWRGLDERLPTFGPADAQATRVASGKVLNAVAPKLPELVGGRRPRGLDERRLQEWRRRVRGELGRPQHPFRRTRARNGAILNGLACTARAARRSTFLIFSDYMRPPIRLAALCDLPVIYVFTHDSIGLGRTVPRISRSSSSLRCARFPTSSSSARPTRPRRWRRGAWRSCPGAARLRSC